MDDAQRAEPDDPFPELIQCCAKPCCLQEC